jgi:hypothetical protein
VIAIMAVLAQASGQTGICICELGQFQHGAAAVAGAVSQRHSRQGGDEKITSIVN